MSILIQCPQCGRELKLPDRSLLGRKGKCPKCQHAFVLKEAAETQSISHESAQPEIPPPVSAPEPATPVPTPPSFQTSPEPIVSAATDSSQASSELPDFFTLPPEVSIGAAARIKEVRRKRSQQRNIGLAIAAAVLVLASGIALIASRMGGTKTKPDHQAKSTASESIAANDEDAGEIRDEFDPALTEYAAIGSPTKGKPIDLKMIPFGAQVVIHLHPADLWKSGSHGQELGQCVPALTGWVDGCLQELFFCSAESIEELTVCLIPGLRGSLPEVAAVARMIDEHAVSGVQKQLGEPLESGGRPISIFKNSAYLVLDSRTVAVCPASQVEEMTQAIERAHPFEEFDSLLPLTDKDRQFTMLLTPVTLGLHDAWFPENLRPLVRSSLDWLGENIETFGFSFHLSDDLFYSEILLRNKKLSAKKLEQQFRQKIGQLAEDLVPLIQQMRPNQSGKRMLIGRLPAMLEVFSMATITSPGPHHVQIVTPLPERAAPNLLLGSYLVWDESTRTVFQKVKAPPDESMSGQAKVSDQLKKRIDVDFRATPFNEAFAYLSSEINVPIELNGDALKAGGFTKNLKQTFQMDAARVQDVIVRIFEESKGVDENPQKKLIIVVDESRKSILVTTLAAAIDQGLTGFDLK